MCVVPNLVLQLHHNATFPSSRNVRQDAVAMVPTDSTSTAAVTVELAPQQQQIRAAQNLVQLYEFHQHVLPYRSPSQRRPVLASYGARVDCIVSGTSR